jgi:hypothetical protein
MKEPELEEISGGSAISKQAFVLCLITPFLLFMVYLILRVNLALPTIGFSLVLLSAIGVLIWRAFSYADIYFLGNTIVYKKIFKTTIRPLTDVKTINEAFLPINYVITFKDDSKIYFTLTVEDALKRFGSQNVTEILAERFRERLRASESKY